MPAGEVVLMEAGRRCSLVSSILQHVLFCSLALFFFEACIICLGGGLYGNEI